MKNGFLAFLLLSFLNGYTQISDPELWYKQPAAKWTEALPVGNGRLGAMVFGDFQHENIQINTHKRKREDPGHIKPDQVHKVFFGKHLPGFSPNKIQGKIIFTGCSILCVRQPV